MATEISRVIEKELKEPTDFKGNETKRTNFWKRLKLAFGDKSSTLNGAINLIQNNSITLRNLIIGASTYGLERLLNAKVFHCPQKNFQQYGLTFLLAPVIVLFFVNVLVIGEVWKLSARIYIKRYERRGDCFTRISLSLAKACVGPVVWLIVAFLEEDYYLCAKLGPYSETESEIRQQRIAECKSQSHVIAWIVFVSFVVIGSVLVVWKNCLLKDNLLMENLYSYERREALSAKKVFTELMGSKCEDADLDNDPMTGEYGNHEEKVTLYKNGIPEIIGKKTVEKLFEGYKGDNWSESDGWHYIEAYQKFKDMFPRISTGNPRHPWRAGESIVHSQDNEKNSATKWQLWRKKTRKFDPTSETKI